MTLWTNYFLNYGGEFLDAKGNILTDGPEAIEATKFYQRLLTKVAPPGVAGFNWMESMAVLHAGPRRDVDRRRRLGAAAGRPERLARRRQGRLRDGPRRTEGPVFGDLWRRHRHRGGEQEQGSRLSLCQWAVSKTQGARLLQAGGGVPFRNSVLNDEEVQQGRQDAAGMAAVGDRLRRRSASSACRSSFRLPNSAISSAPPSRRRCRAPIRRRS